MSTSRSALLLAGAMAVAALVALAGQSSADDYWKRHWHWYDNNYGPYYHGNYYRPGHYERDDGRWNNGRGYGYQYQQPYYQSQPSYYYRNNSGYYHYPSQNYTQPAPGLWSSGTAAGQIYWH
jgi:hypothetical protein